MNFPQDTDCRNYAHRRLTCGPGRAAASLIIGLMLAVLALSAACSQSGQHPRTIRPRMNLPECIIIRSGQAELDPGIESYKNLLNAVALRWRILPPDALASLPTSGNRLILIMPMRTARSLTSLQVQATAGLVQQGALLVSEGVSPLAEKLGFRAGRSIPVRYLTESAYPDMEISWKKEVQVPSLQAPEKAIVLNRERDTRAPMVSLLPYGQGGCLLFAAELDPERGEGYARFPYFHQELRHAGIQFPFRSERLSAFFDYAYRTDTDPDALAEFWRQSGISALHVGAWYYFDNDQKADDYLRKLITACHRNGILVYAWLEFPHVSEGFWNRHPNWREKTATGRDAEVDWRLLMNLKDPECFNAVASESAQLLRRFEWDGVNLSELYFDGTSGAREPDDFTPMNTFVRADYKTRHGIDPVEFFSQGSTFFWKRNAVEWKKFVEYRIGLETELNERFIQLFTQLRKSSMPWMHLVVTYVDNIYDPSMRESIGADVNEIFRLLDKYNFTLILEDPGSVWHLGPRRYAHLAGTYSSLTRNAARLAIDINIVDRSEKVHPTSKQTGSEFLELFYFAGRHFQTVMAYSEQTLLPQDAELVSCALAARTWGEAAGPGIQVHSPTPVIYNSGMRQASFNLDGKPWPCADRESVLLPAGTHWITADENPRADYPRLTRFNGELLHAEYAAKNTIEFSYSASQRAIAIFSAIPKSVMINRVPAATSKTEWILLPAGDNKVRAVF